MASVLFNLFLQITKCAAHMATRTTLDDVGFETLQLLREQVGRTRRQTMVSTVVRHMLQKFDVTEFAEQFIEWEFVISGYERVTLEKLPSC